MYRRFLSWCAMAIVAVAASARPTLVLDERYDVSVAREAVTADVRLYRTLSKSAPTPLCLPFDMSAEQVAAYFADVQQVTGLRSDGRGFETVAATTIQAATPYLVRGRKGGRQLIEVGGVAIHPLNEARPVIATFGTTPLHATFRAQRAVPGVGDVRGYSWYAEGVALPTSDAPVPSRDRRRPSRGAGKGGPLPATTSKVLLDPGWQFCLGDGSAAIATPAIADSWRRLDLPHDWSVETDAAQGAGGTVVGPFSTNSIGKYQTGHTVGGEGWYLRRFRVESLRRREVTLYFEGAYNHADVWLNGRHIYFNPYGYSSFRFDITDELREGDNVLLVRVRNEGNNTRWYAGSGIFRHVWLISQPRLHLDEWGTAIEVSGGGAEGGTSVSVGTCVRNDSRAPACCAVSVDVLDAQGAIVASAQTSVAIPAGGEQPVRLPLAIADARRWSPATPYLYRAVLRLTDDDGDAADRLEKRFGVRTLEFTADRGFLLNGEPTLLRGGCIHHDNGLLGAAAYDRAETRKLELLRRQGYNAVRCSHNMPSEHFLDACDSLGMMVIDEAFDQWLRRKNADDYHRFFAEFSDRDLQTMVVRDRNHPSVIAWSIGNEIPGRIEPAGLEAAARMRETVRAFDTSRPVTAAICGWDEGDAWNSAGQDWSRQDNLAFRSLDIGGYNYLFDKYVHDHSTHPDRVMFGAESFPKQASQNWDLVEQLPYVIGDFVWTAMDYLGEAGIGSAAIRESGQQSMFQAWPWYNGWCGDIDIIGQKKPQSYYRDVVWHRAPVTMAVERPVPGGSHQSVSAWGWQLEQQSWTFPGLTAADTMGVNVYSRAPRVRLYLNGQLAGEAATSATYWAGFRVAYQAGTLRAVNLDAGGRELSAEAFELITTGAPVGLRLTPDRSAIAADGRDLAYVTIELVDADGRVCTSDSGRRLSLAATGEGTLLAAGNASPTDMESFRSTAPRLHEGRALAILKSTAAEGAIRLSVSADGLPDAALVVHTK